MSSKKNPILEMTLAMAMIPDATLQEEVSDAQWADFGRTVATNIFNTDEFTYALTHAALKSKDTKQLLGFVRAFILTGARP